MCLPGIHRFTGSSLVTNERLVILRPLATTSWYISLHFMWASYDVSLVKQFSDKREWGCRVCWVYRGALSVRKMRIPVFFYI